MNCPHFIDGRCSLAERLAMQETGKTLECRPTAVRCSLCVRRGLASEDEPGDAVLGMVTVQAHDDAKWAAFVALKTKGVVRGVGDRIEKVLKKVGVTKTRAAKVAKAVGASGCGCAKRQNLANKILPY